MNGGSAHLNHVRGRHEQMYLQKVFRHFKVIEGLAIYSIYLEFTLCHRAHTVRKCLDLVCQDSK